MAKRFWRFLPGLAEPSGFGFFSAGALRLPWINAELM
jgi:hypothetical protein